MAHQPSTIRELVNSWTRQSGNNLDLLGQLDLLDLMNKELYSKYQPFNASPDYMDRLFAWISGAPSVRDKKLLFKLACWLLFVGEEEMKSLYQASFTGVITRWVIDQQKIDIFANDADDCIREAMKRTFFGSIAGMDMGTYCRVNGIEGQDLRPDFREQAKIGELENLRKYLIRKKYSRIVAVEDYVGSGTQMQEACGCLSQLTDFRVLLCPILVAKQGVEMGTQLANSILHLTFEPVFPIPKEAAIPATRSSSEEPRFFSSLRQAFTRLHDRVRGNNPTQNFSPFGFRDTGSLIMTYLNCPDNVPPIIHLKSDTWAPLFRRNPRGG
jgi:hypothetical protein